MRKVSSSRLLTKAASMDGLTEDDVMLTPMQDKEEPNFLEAEVEQENVESDEDRSGWDEDEKLLDDTTREAKKLRKESKTRIATIGKQYKV